ncbi:MAG: glycosyltransferase [Synechococcus sp.]
MNDSVIDLQPLHLVLVSTPIGSLGSGRGGGVELTLASLVRGLVGRGHRLTLVAPEGSLSPCRSSALRLETVPGLDQPSWQHADRRGAVTIPADGLLPRLWERALALGLEADAVLNFAYDWLPFWLTPRVSQPLFHLVSMGSVAKVMDQQIADLAHWDQRRLAFHTQTQAKDFALQAPARVVGNGFDLGTYSFQPRGGGPLGWAGRVAPEKGLEDAAAVAAALGETLLVWGVREDLDYAERVEAGVPTGTIEWRGFRPTNVLQQELGQCRALINTPKWNEAYGNVVVEALACGVPVVAYNRGGPSELVQHGQTGFLVEPDDVDALKRATVAVPSLDRRRCRGWVEAHASQEVFAQRVERWIRDGLASEDVSIAR